MFHLHVSLDEYTRLPPGLTTNRLAGHHGSREFPHFFLLKGLYLVRTDIMFERFFFDLLWLILGILQGLSLYGTCLVSICPDSPGTSTGMSRAQGAELGDARLPKLHKLISQRSSILRAGTCLRGDIINNFS